MNAIAPKLCTTDGRELLFEGVIAKGDVRGLCLNMSVEQHFRNPGADNVEVVYTFPLPWRAMLMGVDVVLGDKHLTGVVTEKAKAARIYEDTIADGNTAIMLERNADQSYTLNLGNLAAQERCVVTIRYAQTLAFEQGNLRLLIPTTIAPRYGDMVKDGGLQPHQTTTHDLLAEYDFGITLHLHGLLARARIGSPSHPVTVLATEVLTTVTLGKKAQLDRDFILVLDQLEHDSMAIMAPDFVKADAVAVLASFRVKLPEGANQKVAVKILVDCSGSMAGDSIEAAKRSLHAIINQFDAGDRFSVSKFGNDVAHRGRALWKVTDATKAAGRRWIDELDADMGGTEMEGALQSTFNLAHSGACDVLLITDGEISAIDATIETAKTSSHRVFVVGIGSSPAEVHLRRLASETGGACDFVAPGEAVEPAILRMFNRLRSSRMQQLALQWPVSQKPTWATPVNATAFDGDTVTVYAQFDQAIVGDVSLLCTPMVGAEPIAIGSAQLGALESDGGTISRMAAYAHIDALGRIEGARSIGLERTIALAVAYQLLTDQTNFILTLERAESERATDMPRLNKVAQMMAAGHSGMGSVESSTWAPRFRSGTSVREPSTAYDAPMFCRQDFDAVDVSAATPSVWRTSRSSSSDRTQVDKKLDTINTPQYSGLSPMGILQCLDGKNPGDWPSTYAALRKMGVGVPIIDWLELVVGQDHSETEVVAGFLAAVIEQKFSAFSNGVVKGLMTLAQLMPLQQRVLKYLRSGILQIDQSLQTEIAIHLLTPDARAWNEVFFNATAEFEDN